MARTDTDVLVTSYTAHFAGVPFGSRRWWQRGTWRGRVTLTHRRASTVVADYVRDGWRELTGADVPTDKASIDMAGAPRFVVLADTPGSRYGTMLRIEQRPHVARTHTWSNEYRRRYYAL